MGRSVGRVTLRTLWTVWNSSFCLSHYRGPEYPPDSGTDGETPTFFPCGTHTPRTPGTQKPLTRHTGSLTPVGERERGRRKERVNFREKPRVSCARDNQ